MSSESTGAWSSLSTWDAWCKDCRNAALRAEVAGQPSQKGKRKAKGKRDLRQERYEYSDIYATKQFERGQSRSDRCPECRKRHKKEISAFPVAYIDITAIGEASKYVTNPDIGPTGPLGGLGPLPNSHNKRTDPVNLKKFALGLTDEHIVKLLGIMAVHQVVVLEAGTGTGKSTLAPFRLMNPPPNAPYRPTDVGPIIVTEPRVPATTGVAQFVGEEMCFGHNAKTCFNHVGPGYPVGYQCEGNKVWDEACSLIYVTDGTMVNWITNGDLARIGTVVVDEAHERSENIDLVLTLLAAKLPRYPHLRVVIASATIDKAYFMRFFEQTPSIKVAHYFVEAKKQIGYGVPLFADIEFSPEILENGYTAVDSSGEPRLVMPGWPDEPNAEEGGKSLRSLTRELYLDLRHPAPDWSPWNKDGVIDAAVEQTMKILRATDTGDVLVFMPSKDLITRVQTGVRLRVKDEIDAVGVVTTHWLMRETPQKEKDAALASCTNGERKVVVASNLAETSLTIAGIKYVVDAGLVIQAEWDPDLAVSHAPLRAHSQSGVRQRWGRVGRTTHGWVFPLYSLQDYLAMARDTPAGSTQTNLERTILKLVAAGEDPTTVVFPADFEAENVVRDSFALQSADRFRRERERALAAAKTNGALSRDGKSLTRFGAELTRSRTSPEKAIALMFADRLACVPEVATALVALAGMDGNRSERDRGRLAGPRRLLAANKKWPLEWSVHARRCHEALSLDCEDDLDLVIRVFAEWMAAPDPSSWCAQWWINEDVLDELSAAAGKLMDGLAPGMSKEAKRPLDPRLGGRARAVLSRALGSLRYDRIAPNEWRSANPNQPESVVVSGQRLLPAADQVIGLVRERPSSQRWGRVVREGELLGLISWLEWAAEGDPTDFELLRRASLRRDELQEVRDSAKQLRASYPIGAKVRVSTSPTGAVSLRKLADGPSKPKLDPDDVDEADKENDEPSESGVAYTSETATADEFDHARAGVEVPEEEACLKSIPISELEINELEDFACYETASSKINSTPRSETGVLDVRVSATIRGHDAADEWCGIVRGYRLDGPTAELLLDPAPVLDSAPRQTGDSISAVVFGQVDTHFGVACEMRECDKSGVPLVAPPIYLDGAVFDVGRGADAAALRPGSVWDVRVVKSDSDYGEAQYSVAESIYAKVTSGPTPPSRGKNPTIASFTAVLTGDVYRDQRQQENLIATTDVFGPDLIPEFSIWPGRLEFAGIAAIAGSRIKIDLAANSYPRSGKWRPEDIEFLVERYPDLFERGSKPEFLAVKDNAVLSERALTILLQVDPSSSQYEVNAWQLWATSRQVTVKRVSALGEAALRPEAITALKESTDFNRLKSQFSVGIVLQKDGTVIVSGDTPNVAAALDHIRGAATSPRLAIKLPGRFDGYVPRFPSRDAVHSALDGNIEKASEVASGYNPRIGRLPIADSTMTRDEALHVASVLRPIARLFTIQLTFAEPKGFYAFKKKERWNAIASKVPGVNRWLIEGGVSWGLCAPTAMTLTDAVGSITAALPAVRFNVSATEELWPTVESLPSVTDRFEVSYLSPGVDKEQSSSGISKSSLPSSSQPPTELQHGRLNVSDTGQRAPDDSEGSLEVRTPEPEEVPARRVTVDRSAPIRRIRDVRDGCTVIDTGDGNYLIVASDGRTAAVLAASYKNDARPLHWLLQNEA